MSIIASQITRNSAVNLNSLLNLTSKDNQSSALLALCEWNPMVLVVQKMCPCYAASILSSIDDHKLHAWHGLFLFHVLISTSIYMYIRADSRFAPSQWETALLCNGVSHWLGASLKSALCIYVDAMCRGSIFVIHCTWVLHLSYLFVSTCIQ